MSLYNKRCELIEQLRKCANEDSQVILELSLRLAQVDNLLKQGSMS